MHRLTAPRSDLPSRVLLSQHMVRLIHLYLPGDPQPRRLFLAEGEADMDMAWSASRAQALADDQQKQFLLAIEDPADPIADQSLTALFQSSLQSAVVAFENAIASSSLAPPMEPSSTMEPTVMLGDAFYALGNQQQAKNEYAKALGSKFTEEGEPADELLWLARAAARWAVLLFNEGACKTSSPRIAEWDAAWIPLGAAADHDLCRLGQPGLPGPAELDKFGVMGLVYPLVAESVRQCANHDPTAADSTPSASDRLKILDCLRSTGPDASLGLPLSEMSSTEADREIATFLSRSPAGSGSESNAQ